MDSIFIDTNLPVYTVDDGNLEKQQKAKAIMDKIVETSMPVISTQVLQEFYNASTTKLGIDRLLAKSIVHNLQNMMVVQDMPVVTYCYRNIYLADR